MRRGWVLRVSRAPSRPCVCPGRLARQDGRHALAEYLLSARPGAGGLGGTASQTGLALQGLLAAMLAFSSPCIRRSGHFEVGPAAAPRDWESPSGAKAAPCWGAGQQGEGPVRGCPALGCPMSGESS